MDISHYFLTTITENLGSYYTGYTDGCHYWARNMLSQDAADLPAVPRKERSGVRM